MTYLVIFFITFGRIGRRFTKILKIGPMITVCIAVTLQFVVSTGILCKNLAVYLHCNEVGRKNTVLGTSYYVVPNSVLISEETLNNEFFHRKWCREVPFLRVLVPRVESDPCILYEML